MIVKYSLSADEYVESELAFRQRMAKGRVLFRNMYGLAAVAVVLGIYVRLSGAPWWGAALLLGAGFLLLERALMWRLRDTAAYRASPAIAEPVEVKIDDQNIVRTSAAGSTEIRWANISACHETKNLFLLRDGENDQLVLPKRAFSPGDLFGFKELRQKELIVKTTRENPDILLLRFIVGYGLIAATVAALGIGFVDNFLTDFSRRQRTRSIATGTRSAPRITAKPVPASPAELRGRGEVYVIPLGPIKNVSVPQLLEDFQKHYGLQLRLLPAISPPAWARNAARKQFAAEDLIAAMKLAYPAQAAEPDAVLIGLTDEDMYISEIKWTYAFSFRSEERFAVISSSHLSEPADDDDDDNPKPVTAEVVQKRAAKVLARDVGILHYRLQPSNNYGSILYKTADAPELDDVGDDYLESDVLVRANLHVESGDPCFILRHYSTPERDHPESGAVDGCSGYYKELNLETVQIDLRYGLLMDQRTDFFVQDRIPLELTRVLRTQDERSRAFGVGGNHNLDIFLVGDKWPFTWLDVVLENGGRSHFQRSNWGFGYWDARYTNRDAIGSEFSGSTIDWAWPGWKLKHRGLTYLFPDPNGAPRPEQGALVEIETYDHQRLALTRDGSGNLLRARSPAGHELNFKYDQSNRVIEVGQKTGGHFEYSYDAAGHLVRVKDAEQRVTEYFYDESGRMNRIAGNEKDICRLEYDASGRVKSETLADGRTYGFNYSVAKDGTISQVDISDSAGPMRRLHISAVEYTLDVSPHGRR